jgi:RimJ/RimL family protein N-acetyltransferase
MSERSFGAQYVVYSYPGMRPTAGDTSLPDGYTARLWRPSLSEPLPRGARKPTLAVWTAFHVLGVFSNREYGQLLISHERLLVHRSGVFPRSPRFPFMGSQDLQIGNTWTHPAHRGRGLARFAIREIVSRHARQGRTFWYIVEANNAASIRAVEAAGFARTSDSDRTSRFGSRLLGAYVLRPRD